MEEEGGNKIQNLYGSFTFHVKLCFQHRVHWWDGWKKEANSIEEEDAMVVCYSSLEAAMACIGQTINDQKIIGIHVVKVENHDASVDIDARKEAIVKEEELRSLQEEKNMSSETHVESTVDFQNEEGADWSEVAEQGSQGVIVALEGFADGMALAKIARHSYEDYEPMELDDEVQDERSCDQIMIDAREATSINRRLRDHDTDNDVDCKPQKRQRVGPPISDQIEDSEPRDVAEELPQMESSLGPVFNCSQGVAEMEIDPSREGPRMVRDVFCLALAIIFTAEIDATTRANKEAWKILMESRKDENSLEKEEAKIQVKTTQKMMTKVWLG